MITPSSDGTGSANSGLPEAVTAYWPVNQISQNTDYSAGPGGDSFSVSCSPTVTFSGGSSDAYVQYSAGAGPVTLGPPSGTTLDSSGNPNILVGQPCTGTVDGIPTTDNGWQSTYSWSVSGTTFETWSATTPAIGTAPANPNASYYNPTIPATNPASWYWNDLQGASETVKCTATVTPPSGEGSPFSLTVTAPKPIKVQVPKYTFTATGGRMQINTAAPNENNVLCLYAGGMAGGSSGVSWDATCTTPTTPAFGKGSVELIQIATPNLSYTAYTGSMVPGAQHNDPENGKTGLDGQCPYPSSSYTEGGPDFTSNDSPAAPLSNSMGSITMKHQFVDYLMYLAPGSTQAVPLATLTWGTNGSASIPSTGNWGNYAVQNGSDSAGTVTTTDSTAGNTFPSWTLINGPVTPGSF